MKRMAPESEKSNPRKSGEEQLHDLLPGIVSSRGWWRLSVVAGAVIATPWIVFVLYTVDARDWSNPDDGLRLLGLTLASFFLPWLIVQLIGWAVEGFKQQK
ncbi:MAG: hypothetical protein WCE23_09735 [Candidatus Binatus sp.]|uniref:hypothetical protein n=1 Tax=Candidatus Binatus sp. TaxID=2811406 RepID=UPI003C70D5E3